MMFDFIPMDWLSSLENLKIWPFLLDLKRIGKKKRYLASCLPNFENSCSKFFVKCFSANLFS